MIFDKGEIFDWIKNSSGDAPKSVTPFSFNITVTEANLATEVAKYIKTGNGDLLYGTLRFSPGVNAATAYDFTAEVTGQNSKVFSFNYKDTSGTYLFTDQYEFTNVIVKDFVLTDAYSNGTIYIDFVGYKIIFTN